MGRQDLSRAEMMTAVKRLRDEFTFSGAEIARRTGRNQSDISALLRLADDQEMATLVMDERLPASNAAIIQRLPGRDREEIVAALRAGHDFTTEELRARARALRRPQGRPDADRSPHHTTAGVVNSLPFEQPSVLQTDIEVANDGMDGVVNSLPTADPMVPTGAAGGSGRKRPELVTLNNLAREIEAFCDRHDPGRFTAEEAAPLTRAAARLVAHLQRARGC